ACPAGRLAGPHRHNPGRHTAHSNQPPHPLRGVPPEKDEQMLPDLALTWDSARALDATLSTLVLLLIVPAAYAVPGLALLRRRFPRWVTVHMVLLGLTGLGA